MNIKRMIACLVSVVLVLLLAAGCSNQTVQKPETSQPQTQKTPQPTAIQTSPPPKPDPTPEPADAWQVNSDGDTLETRVPVPEGYARIDCAARSFGAFLRSQPMEPDGSPVRLFDGSEKANQRVHVAVFSIDVGERDRQQCADAALRLRAEYWYANGEFDKISYHLTNGFLFPYNKYAAGYRLKVDGNETWLEKEADADTSYAAFRRYLDLLFAYAGTISVSEESTPVDINDMQIGDIFVYGGSPGHCVIVVDMCENQNTGEKAFLLAQSYMPAQQIHVLVNPLRDDPWYRISELIYPFHTPEWTFQEVCLKRMP